MPIMSRGRMDARGRDHWVSLISGLVGVLAGGAIAAATSYGVASRVDDADTRRQVREMKQTQYAASYKAMELEASSYGAVFDALRRGDVVAASRQISQYSNKAELEGE